MDNREKVIKGIEWALENMVDPFNDFRFAGYDGPIVLLNEPIVREVIALLKAQETRVIQFDEIENYEVLYLEVRDVETEDGLAPWVKTRSGKWFSPLLCGKMRPDMILSTPEEYGAICRCWTSRPTDEQREATPWN